MLSLLGLGVAFCLAKPHLLYANPTFGGGSGTEQDPYRLSTPEHLTELQVAVDGGNSFAGKYFVMTNDIDFTGYDNDADPDNGNFDPIGYFNSSKDERVFSGHFDGKNNTISNVRISLPNTDGVALFGNVSEATMENVSLKNIQVNGEASVGGLAGFLQNSTILNCESEGLIVGGQYVGGLVGWDCQSILDQVTVMGHVEGDFSVAGITGRAFETKINHSVSKASVSGNQNVGGIAAYSYGSQIKTSMAEGVIEGNSHVGGLVGYARNSEVLNSYSMVELYGEDSVGGLIGDSYLSNVSQSFSKGRIEADSWVGGLVGALQSGILENVYSVVDVVGNQHVGGLIGNNWGDFVLRNAYHIGSVTGTTNVGRISGWHEENSVIENVYYNQEENENLPIIGLDESTVPLGDIVGLNLNQMSQANSQNYMTLLDFENVWVTTSTTPMFRWQKDLMSANRGDIQINGIIQTMIADVTIPSVSPDLVIDPNSPDGAISPEFGITNDSTSPIKLDLKTFEQTTNSFNDVLPTKYDSWEGLNKTQSQDLALGLVAKEGDGWQRLTVPTSYASGHTEHEIGVMKPTSQVNFEFEVHHGRAFSETKTVQYRMVFVFDLLS